MRYLLLCFLVCATQLLYAQNTVTRYDIAKGTESSFPLSFVEYRSKLYFYAFDSNKNQQVWSTNGNDEPVRTIIMGNDTDMLFNTPNSFPNYANDSRHMVVINNKLYLIGRYGTSHFCLYQYDGSDNIIIKDADSGKEINNCKLLATHNNELYFLRFYDAWQLCKFNLSSRKLTRLTNFSSANTTGVNYFMHYNNNIILTTGKNFSYNRGYDGVWEYSISNNTLHKIHTTTGSDNYYSFQVNSNVLYFARTMPTSSFTNNFDTIYSYTGTGMASPVSIGDIQYIVSSFFVDNDIIYFNGSTNTQGRAICWYNIRDKKAGIIKTINSTPTTARCFKKILNTVVFSHTPAITHGTFWQLNGINEPTLLSEKVNPYNDDGFEYNGSYYFTGYDSSWTISHELNKYTNAKLSVNNTSTPLSTTTLYPNPSKDYATLSINLQQSQTLHISITDAQGRLVYNIPTRHYSAQQHRIQLPVAQLAAGVYQYAISNGITMLASGKLVRE